MGLTKHVTMLVVVIVLIALDTYGLMVDGFHPGHYLPYVYPTIILLMLWAIHHRWESPVAIPPRAEDQTHLDNLVERYRNNNLIG